MGAKKLDMSFETQETKLFGRISQDLCRDIPGVPEKFAKKEFVFHGPCSTPNITEELEEAVNASLTK